MLLLPGLRLESVRVMGTSVATADDVSPDFRWNKVDLQTIRKILRHETTPEAIKLFDRYAYRLTDYAYWFMLSTLWVGYTGYSDLNMWKRLLGSDRSKRETSIMKPSELRLFHGLADPLILYRAHRPNEQDWIAYTLSAEKAAVFAKQRGVDKVREYRVPKAEALCLFLRRGELEVLVLDKGKAEFVQELTVLLID